MLFQNLSSEIFKEIFNYLTFEEICQSLIGLTKYIDDIIQDYPVNIFCLSKIKSFEQYYSFQCRTLILSGSDLYLFEKISSHWNLKSLRIILLRKMNFLTLSLFIKILPIEQLESIIIKHLICAYYPKDFYSEIWSILIKRINSNILRYLSLPFHIYYWQIEKPLNHFVKLKDLTLEYISNNQILEFLNYTPNIRRLKMSLARWHKVLLQSKVILRKLAYLELNLYDNWSLQAIEQLIYICPYVQCLILKLEICDEITEIFKPIVWQRLIEEKLNYLNILQLQINFITSVNVDINDYETRFNQNEYWNRRKLKFRMMIKQIRRL